MDVPEQANFNTRQNDGSHNWSLQICPALFPIAMKTGTIVFHWHEDAEHDFHQSTRQTTKKTTPCNQRTAQQRTPVHKIHWQQKQPLRVLASMYPQECLPLDPLLLRVPTRGFAPEASWQLLFLEPELLPLPLRQQSCLCIPF